MLLILSDILLAILFILAFKKAGKKALLSFFIAFILSTLIKYLTNVSRPIGYGYSFPSRHTTMAFSLAYYLDPKFYLLALLTGVLRILSGYHRIEDIIVGAILGYLISHTLNNLKDLDERILKNKGFVVRKFIHIILTSFFILLILIGFYELIPFASLFLMILYTLTYYIFKVRIVAEVTKIARKNFEEKIPIGVYSLLFSVFIASLLGLGNLTLLLLLFLADAFAAFYGKFFGKHKILNKNLEGSLAGFLLLFIILYPINLYLAIFFSLGFLLIDLLHIPDDNFAYLLLILLKGFLKII